MLAYRPLVRADVSFSQAMLGDVNPNLNEIAVKALDMSLEVYFYFDIEPDQTILDWVERIMNRARPDFPDCSIQAYSEFLAEFERPSKQGD